jgi:addiction module HigA family antidote
MLLEEFLKPMNLTQTELASRIAVPLNRVNEIIKGKRGVTADTALRLARLFDMDPQFWLNLQALWDLYHAEHSPTAAEIKQIRKIRTA